MCQMSPQTNIPENQANILIPIAWLDKIPLFLFWQLKK